VLTFDDGPSVWTVEILDILAARGVKATFFVVGARAADRPDLVKRMYADGHDVGVHTFTHANLANVSTWRFHLELDQTQLALAGGQRDGRRLSRGEPDRQQDRRSATPAGPDRAALGRTGRVHFPRPRR
jgi:peptidoglycan-N-acetylglucosamine deacetylase